MPGVSCPHQRLYRTVQPLRAEAPHPGVDSLFDRSQSNRKYNYNYIFTQICGGGKCLSHFVHSFIPTHSLVYNTCKYFSTKLFIHFIISSYGILCRHSYTPLLTQTHEIESRKYITSPWRFTMSRMPKPLKIHPQRSKKHAQRSKMHAQERHV